MLNKISIVTICFNNLSELIKTIQSVNIQSLKPFQHIIIDGSSNSEIKNWLDNNPQPNYREWHCQRDKGIYDAFNIGLKHVTGNIVEFLNSGDIFSNPNVISIVEEFFINNPAISWCSAKFKVYKYNEYLEMGEAFDKKLLFRGMRKINHQTCFVLKTLFDKHGGFENYKVGMDYDFIARIANENYKFINEVLVEYDNTGNSNILYLKGLRDTIIIYEKYYGFSLKCRLWQFRNKILYFLFKYDFFKKLFIRKFK